MWKTCQEDLKGIVSNDFNEKVKETFETAAGATFRKTYTVRDMDKSHWPKKGHCWKYLRSWNADKSSSSQPTGPSTGSKLLKSMRKIMYVGFSVSVVSVKHKFPICYGTYAGSGHVTPSPRHTQHTFKSVCFSVSYQANTLDLCTTEKELKCENIILLSTLM